MIDIFAYTSHGGREYNEDSVGFAYTADGAVMLVADGLGGHMGGDIASKTVVDTVLAAPLESELSDEQWLTRRLDASNDLLLTLQKEHGNKMKSTAVALKISGSSATWAHAGDSRLYYIHRSAIAAVTEDHSVAYKKFKAGEISRADIATDEDQSSLLRSLGNRGEVRLEFGSAKTPLEHGDGFMLCSDGAWEYLQDQEIVFDFLKSDSAQLWAELLLLRIIERMEPDSDNLSVVTAIIK